MLFLIVVDVLPAQSDTSCDPDADVLCRVGTGGIEVFNGAIPVALLEAALRTER